MHPQPQIIHIQLMKVSNALGNARKEMLATVVSNVNDCYY